MESIGGVVNVRVSENPGSGRSSSDHVGDTTGFDDSASASPTDDSGIVGSADRHTNDFGCAVGGQNGEGINKRAASVQSLDTCIGVVESVGPSPTCRHGVSAITIGGQCSGGNRLESVGSVIDVGVGEDARCGRGSD